MYQIRVVLYEMQNDELIYLKETKFDEMIFITCTEYRGQVNRELKKSMNRFSRKRKYEISGTKCQRSKRPAKLPVESLDEKELKNAEKGIMSLLESSPSSPSYLYQYQYNSPQSIPSSIYDSLYPSSPEEYQMVHTFPQTDQLSPSFQTSPTVHYDFYNQQYYDNSFHENYFQSYNRL